VIVEERERGPAKRTEKRPDARTERWREHRAEVRAEFVDATFRALGKYGPEVSMDDIAKEAGTAKPKLYRHFKDKIDLFDAVVDRVQDMLWERILASINLMRDSTRELVHRGSTEYAQVVTEHPNVFRFMVHSHATRQADESERALQSARQSARRAAELFANALDENSIKSDHAELTIYLIFGAVASATDWWLGANRTDAHPMPVEEFVEYLTTSVSSLVESTARLDGITVDPDLPLHLAFSNENPPNENPPNEKPAG
jgi:AcrR family transcriptional regulator